jgi:hypothetical protein
MTPLFFVELNVGRDVGRFAGRFLLPENAASMYPLWLASVAKHIH